MPDPVSLPGWLLERRSDAASREMVAASFGKYRIRLTGPLNFYHTRPSSPFTGRRKAPGVNRGLVLLCNCPPCGACCPRFLGKRTGGS